MGVERIIRTFENSHPAFMPYMVLGYPEPEISHEVLKMLEESGADLLELGIPFSDPIADGSIIQNATHTALCNGLTVSECLSIVTRFRADGGKLPLLFMGYINPILAYGVSRFVTDSAQAGVDGFIVPDLPPEEAADFEEACKNNELALVYLVAPTSTEERIKLVCERSTGFVYLVSVTGVTGARESLPEDLSAFIARIRNHTYKPLAVGFGIGNGVQAKMVGGMADGVIVGSALVQKVGESLESARKLAVEIRTALGRKTE